MIGGELCRFISLYRSPNQSQDDFESFAENFELKIGAIAANNLFLTVVLSDFNIKCKTSSYEGSKIDAVIDAVWITTSN